MRNWIVVLVVLVATSALAVDMQPSDSGLIDSAGIPLYPKGTFVYGNKDVGFRFASAEPVETVKEWYRGKLAQWSLFDQYGSWILYDGAPAEGLADIMSRKQVAVSLNDNLPVWYKLDKAMTTEIVIMVPR